MRDLSRIRVGSVLPPNRHLRHRPGAGGWLCLHRSSDRPRRSERGGAPQPVGEFTPARNRPRQARARLAVKDTLGHWTGHKSRTAVSRKEVGWWRTGWAGRPCGSVSTASHTDISLASRGAQAALRQRQELAAAVVDAVLVARDRRDAWALPDHPRSRTVLAGRAACRREGRVRDFETAYEHGQSDGECNPVFLYIPQPLIPLTPLTKTHT